MSPSHGLHFSETGGKCPIAMCSSDLLQLLFQCKKCSENTAGNGTQRKTVIFTADIFAVYV